MYYHDYSTSNTLHLTIIWLVHCWDWIGYKLKVITLQKMDTKHALDFAHNFTKNNAYQNCPYRNIDLLGYSIPSVDQDPLCNTTPLVHRQGYDRNCDPQDPNPGNLSVFWNVREETARTNADMTSLSR